MRRQFFLFQSPLDLAHEYWQFLIKEGDTAIDATCGNGKDTAFLAKLPTSIVYAFDIQAEALEKAQVYFQKNLSREEQAKIKLYQQCHSQFPEEIQQVKLIVYNLGYLPGSDKAIKTQSESTLESLNHALKLIVPGGAISVTCYPGHTEGKIEQDNILQFSSSLSNQDWSACHHVWTNRKDAPTFLLLQRSL